ncbi:protein-glutamate O-methyltransferase CheR [Segetibacter sp. 3557_3]|uniref:CheR family methyltransferase n=1 Tax=Segetibacter sp. 3557_3 TaxID=2547429 RepID=UPI00105899EB|nr:protein-glutamate O-methyltransferase CheR [Segetibacter sp. 3557_3]TDH29151.1 protein-glutamate O-methyltransferase CheR [Segetibacter sp. 3557_3]
MSRVIELTDQELTEVLQLINQLYGYDFTGYASASMHRRVYRFMHASGLNTYDDLRYNLSEQKATFEHFLEFISVNVTEMFRDPEFFKTIKEEVFPRLATYPLIRIWHAGCATGEEVFSMAILLKEAGLLERTRIYATDINPVNIEKAKKGIMTLQVIKDYTANYIKSGGSKDFSGYYTALYNNALISKELRENILFSQHNLVTDQVFNEFQLVCCRNVMIYFNKGLQNKVLHLLHDSLAPLGYLALGPKESLLFTDIADRFEVISPAFKIFRRNQ